MSQRRDEDASDMTAPTSRDDLEAPSERSEPVSLDPGEVASGQTDPDAAARSRAGSAAEDDEPEEGVVAEARESLPPWKELSDARRMAVLEALLFAAERPLSLKDLRDMLGIRSREILRVIDLIRADLAHHRRGLTLEEVAGGFVFRTRVELAPWIRVLLKARPPRISRAQLEALAIVAYRQPVTRAEVEQVRGVESGHLMRGLLEKRLIRILGRKDDIGRPMIYGTTREFLLMFGLKDLTSLPTLRDLATLMGKKQGPEPIPDGQEGVALELDSAALPWADSDEDSETDAGHDAGMGSGMDSETEPVPLS